MKDPKTDSWRPMIKKRARNGAPSFEATFAALMQQAGDAFVVHDWAGAILDVNPRACELLGYTRDELLAKTMPDIDLDLHPPHAEDLLRRALAGEHSTFESRLRRKDGSITPAEITLSALHLPGSQSFLAIVRDVTQRREREEVSRQIIESMTDAAYVVDLDSRFLAVNDRACEVLGYPRRELLTMSTTDIDCGLMSQEIKQILAETAAGRRQVVETQHRTKDGRIIPSQVALSPLSHLGQQAVLGISRDITQQRQAEAALQALTRRNLAILQTIPDIIAEVDENKVYTWVNDSALHFFGKDVVGREAAYYFVNEQDTYDTVRPLFTGDADTRYVESWQRRQDGQDRLLAWWCRSLKDESGRVVGALSTGRDITERWRAEEALLQSEERFRSLASMTTEGIMIHEDGVIVDANRAFAELIGYRDADELIGRPGLEVLSATEVSRQELIEHLRLRDSELFTIELLRPDGASLWAETQGREVTYRGRPARLVFMRDITERRQAEEALRRSEREFRALFEAAPMGIGVADLEGNILAFNDAMLIPGGYSREDVEKIGNVAALYYDDAGRETALALFLAQGALHQHETRFKRKDGTPYDVWLSLTRTTFIGATSIQAIVEDRTEKKRAEEAQERLETQLRQAAKMESVGRLAGGVAHDFNNMLAVILGHVQLALEQVPSDDRLHADLQEIRMAADRSAGITQQLLAFARRQVAVPKVIDLNSSVQAMMGMLGRLIGEQVRLAWLPGKNLRRVRMDPAQLDQVLVNLCLNARDAIAGAGRVTIETAGVTLDEKYCAEHEGCAPGDYVLLSVTDNGTGMSADALEHLFEPFYTTKDTGKGTGLGLATVYGIVKQNDGLIQVDTSDRGTKVRIYLPSVEEEDAEEERGANLTTSPEGTETVLVVEDEPSVLRLTVRILRKLGYQVLTARGPGEAIRVTQEREDIALVITDVVMPEMNGWELSDRLRALRPGLKVLYVSGYTEEMLKSPAAAKETIAFLQKPFTPGALATTARAVLDRD
jgi:PAS domain S-box-containing protein